jgi:hypothetical protein
MHTFALRLAKIPLVCGSDGKIGGREYFPTSLVEVSGICMMRGASGDKCGNYLLGVRTQQIQKSLTQEVGVLK